MFIDGKKKCDSCGKEFDYFFNNKENTCTISSHIGSEHTVEGKATPNANGYTVEVECPKCKNINTFFRKGD